MAEKWIKSDQENIASAGWQLFLIFYLQKLMKIALEVAKRVGKVHVEMGGTACKVPLAEDYINKVKAKGRIGHKKKMARC